MSRGPGLKVHGQAVFEGYGQGIVVINPKALKP